MRSQARPTRTLNCILAVAVAAIVAGLVASLTTVAPPASAKETGRTQSNTLAKGDRLPFAPKGSACSQNGWPNYERKCLFDHRNVANPIRTVRVIGLDRPAPSSHAVTAALALR